MFAYRHLACGLVGVFSFACITPASAQTASAATVQEGEALFVENCEVCHQADAIGQPGFAPSLTNPELLGVASDTFLEGTIRDGREDTGMPPFAHLGRKNVQAIVAFLRAHTSLPNRAEEVNAQPEAHGDPRLGEQWYNNICSTCHGVDGDGYDAGGTGTAIGLPGFLGKASDGMRVKEVVGAVKKAGYKSLSKDFYGIVATTLRNKKFKRIKRGLYKLAK